jgi:hypothetical protein
MAGFLLGLPFDTEEGGSILLRIVWHYNVDDVVFAVNNFVNWKYSVRDLMLFF